MTATTLRLHATFAIALVLAATIAGAAEPRGGLFAPPSNLEQLAAGEVWVQANTSMKLPRGISARGSFFVAAPLEKVCDFLPVWNPQPHPDLEVHQSRGFTVESDPHFENVRIDEKNPAFRKLLAALRDHDEMQLTSAEMAQIPANVSAEAARTFWSGVLRTRWRDFVTAGLRPAGGGRFDARHELKTLLAEEPNVAEHFAGLLAETPLTQDSPGTPVRCYWQQKNINGVAGFSLGAIYRKDTQFADFEFYVSSGYLVAVTLFELRSIEAAGKTGTLVWQENFASSPLLTGGLGLKRKLATLAIESDSRRTIRAFQKDAQR